MEKWKAIVRNHCEKRTKAGDKRGKKNDKRSMRKKIEKERKSIKTGIRI